MAAMVEGGVEMVFCNESEALEWGQCDDIEGADRRHQTGRATLCYHTGRRGCHHLGWRRRCIALPRKPGEGGQHQWRRGYVCRALFLYALSRGESDLRATEFATLAAGEVVKYFGPRLDRDACLDSTPTVFW